MQIKRKYALTKEQMEKLVSLGFDISDASMFYHYDELCFNYSDRIEYQPSEGYIPTYTLDDLIKKLPYCVEKEYKREIPYEELRRRGMTPKRGAGPQYEYTYEDYYIDTNLHDRFYYLCRGMFSDDCSTIKSDIDSDNLLDAAYNLMVFIVENGYYKLKKK